MILLATNNPGTLNSAVATEWEANNATVHDTTYVQGASLVRDNTVGSPIHFPETNNNVTWIHHVARVDLAGSGEDGHGGPYIFDASGNQLFYLEGSNGNISAQFRGPAAYGGAYVWNGTGRKTFDIMFALNPGAGTATVRMYINGVLNYEAIDVAWTWGNPVRVDFRSTDMANRWQSELIISTESTLGCRLVQMVPAADGFHGTAWEPRSAGVMSPTIETLMATPATGAKISHTIPAWAGPVTHPIQEVWVDAYAVASSEEVIPTQLTALLRMGGVDYESAPKPFTNFPSALNFAFPTNPATGLPWEWVDLTGLEYGLNTVA